MSMSLEKAELMLMLLAASEYCLFLVLLITNSQLKDLRKEAISRGHAIHDPQTGDFRWND